ncbi:MAG: metallophosphoesterase family protein [Thermoleophilia bacterium]|nr:metallophosphoesterase family protein [Thermoleophilia bacterium]
MRVAALYDIHGNLHALEAVLAEIEREAVDAVVLGGDFSAGPLAAETVDRLRGLGERAHFLRGNADRELADPDWSLDDPAAVERLDFARAQLGPERLEFLRSLPEHVVLDVEGLGSVLFCHGSPRTDMEILTRATPEERLAAALDGVDADVVVCGHTHAQWRRDVDGRTVVNAGSVGMPYEGRPGAYWALLGPSVEHRRTEYDVETAAAAYRASGYPNAAEFARETLLEPATAEEATAFFEQLALERPEFAGGP